MKRQTQTHTSEITTKNNYSNYEVIENEQIINSDLKDLTISGSLFSFTLFKNVSFRSCVFFASRIENCEFIDCSFDNCSFQFSNISYCNFRRNMFINCIWEVTFSSNNCIIDGKLDSRSSYFLLNGQNCSQKLTYREENQLDPDFPIIAA